MPMTPPPQHPPAAFLDDDQLTQSRSFRLLEARFNSGGTSPVHGNPSLSAGTGSVPHRRASAPSPLRDPPWDPTQQAAAVAAVAAPPSPYGNSRGQGQQAYYATAAADAHIAQITADIAAATAPHPPTPSPTTAPTPIPFSSTSPLTPACSSAF